MYPSISQLFSYRPYRTTFPFSTNKYIPIYTPIHMYTYNRAGGERRQRRQRRTCLASRRACVTIRAAMCKYLYTHRRYRAPTHVYISASNYKRLIHNIIAPMYINTYVYYTYILHVYFPYTCTPL